MSKPGRPGISYNQFKEVWGQLLDEGRAGINHANSLLGGSKSTIISYRERYEREQSSQKLAILKGVELNQAVREAIAGIKVKEVEMLAKENTQLKERIDEHLALLKEAEEQCAVDKKNLEDAMARFEDKQLSFERQLAASKARIEDMEKREQKLLTRNERLVEQHNQAKQEAAVAKKEVEMLREQIKKK